MKPNDEPHGPEREIGAASDLRERLHEAHASDVVPPFADVLESRPTVAPASDPRPARWLPISLAGIATAAGLLLAVRTFQSEPDPPPRAPATDLARGPDAHLGSLAGSESESGSESDSESDSESGSTEGSSSVAGSDPVVVARSGEPSSHAGAPSEFGRDSEPDRERDLAEARVGRPGSARLDLVSADLWLASLSSPPSPVASVYEPGGGVAPLEGPPRPLVERPAFGPSGFEGTDQE